MSCLFMDLWCFCNTYILQSMPQFMFSYSLSVYSELFKTLSIQMRPNYTQNIFSPSWLGSLWIIFSSISIYLTNVLVAMLSSQAISLLSAELIIFRPSSVSIGSGRDYAVCLDLTTLTFFCSRVLPFMEGGSTETLAWEEVVHQWPSLTKLLKTWLSDIWSTA